MIISEKYKYIFIGLPFSASTALSKELCSRYDGKPILHKHSNIPELLGTKMIDINEYEVLAVFRNPLEIAYTVYTKYRNNPRGIYTNSKFFRENGGYISSRRRRMYQEIQERSMTFKEFIHFANKIPYDNYFSLNSKYITQVIDFTNLNSSFLQVLHNIGIEPFGNLEIVNKTENKLKIELDFWNPKEIPDAFKPFLKEHGHHINLVPNKVSVVDRLIYHLLKFARFRRWNQIDKRQSPETFGVYYDLVQEYGKYQTK